MLHPPLGCGRHCHCTHPRLRSASHCFPLLLVPSTAIPPLLATSRMRTNGCRRLRRQPRTVTDSEGQVSPTSNGTRRALSPSSVNTNPSMREHAMSDLLDYRRDLAILDPAGGRAPRNQQTNPSTGSLGQIAPWMTAAPLSTASADPIPTTFYNDSTDNLSPDSPMSPGIRTATHRPSQTPAASSESPDAAYFTDERRPSIASIATTASSQGSRASGTRGGFRKLQGFFGEEFPGRHSSEFSLPHPGSGRESRKESRSHSYSYNRPHRDRNYSNATDHGREASPVSRPRTPVPAPEVVPFLYQEADVCAILPHTCLPAPQRHPPLLLLGPFNNQCLASL